MGRLPRNTEIKDISQTLRKNMTKEEKRLWYDFLRSYPVQFYRQRIIGYFIVDFYCPSVKLAIELDGLHHLEEDKTTKDIIRMEYLNEFGVTVVRFWNSEVNKSFDNVCKAIDAMVKDLSKKVELEYM
ncbi:MAG: endonuclease domain-containing protein [Clostridiales bacterium]|nr:endonuclease domain-containing protein [Clostridiales bacterium]